MSDDSTSKHDLDVRRQEYLQHRKYLIETSLGQIGQFDKLIVTLSSGALALSLTFIKDISPTPIPCSKFLIFVSWILFTISLIATLLSHYTSHKDMDFEIMKLDKNYEDEREMYDPKNPFRTATILLNILSASMFLIGLCFLVAFTSVNFLG